MEIRCVWEHNGGDSLLYAENFPGAFTRGANRDIAIGKMADEVRSYLTWAGKPCPEELHPVIVQEQKSTLAISDADSDVVFQSELQPLQLAEYEALKALVMQSALDFQALYDSIPDKDCTCLPPRKTFYGAVPRTSREMYEHTKNVNDYYFGEIGVPVDHAGTIVECRLRGFEALEGQAHYLQNAAFEGSYGEVWTLRKLMRRFLWHDRIHAKAMWRMAQKTFSASVPNVFRFSMPGR